MGLAITNDKDKYIDSWKSHVNELIRPFMAADRPFAEWDAIKAELHAMIDQAADNDFPEISCGACTVAVGAHSFDARCRQVST